LQEARELSDDAKCTPNQARRHIGELLQPSHATASDAARYCTAFIPTDSMEPVLADIDADDGG